MYEQLLENAASLFTLILLAILCTPIVGFLRYERKARREELLGQFTPKSINLYFETFFPEKLAAISKVEKLSDMPLVSEFEKNFDARFGFWRYLVSALLLVASAWATLYLALVAAVAWLQNDTAAQVLPSIGVVAVAGAYLSVAAEIIARQRARDLWPRDLLLGGLRMALAVPVGYAFSAMAAEPIGLPVAFMMGAFPVKTLITMSRRLAARKLSLGEEAGVAKDAEPGASELEELQGVRGAIAERLGNDNVSTILQLAYTDPLELTIRTGYSFAFILDCVSQALAWIYLEDQLQILRVLGIRGASEIGNMFEWPAEPAAELDETETEQAEDEPELKENETKHVEAIAKKLKIDFDVCKRMLLEIADDPHTKFIADVWHPGV